MLTGNGPSLHAPGKFQFSFPVRPARRELVAELFSLWSKESVMVQLRANKRNLDIYGKISQGMLEKGHNRDVQQCHVKIKELRQAYQKAREANSRSGSRPKYAASMRSCMPFSAGTPPQYHHTASIPLLHPPPGAMMRTPWMRKRRRMWRAGYRRVGCPFSHSQDLFLTPEQSSSTQNSTNDPGEGTYDTLAPAQPTRTAVERLLQMRKREKKPQKTTCLASS